MDSSGSLARLSEKLSIGIRQGLLCTLNLLTRSM
jgi:hypothetical protein